MKPTFAAYAIGFVMLIGLLIGLPVIIQVVVPIVQIIIQLLPVLFIGAVILAVLWVMFKIASLFNGPRKQEAPAGNGKVLAPIRWKDNTIAGLKIGYLDENGRFCGADQEKPWKNDHMKGAYICAVDPQHPNGHALLEQYAQVVRAKGYEPVQASVSLYGDVQQMDNGELVTSGAADIVTHCKY